MEMFTDQELLLLLPFLVVFTSIFLSLTLIGLLAVDTLRAIERVKELQGLRNGRK